MTVSALSKHKQTDSKGSWTDNTRTDTKGAIRNRGSEDTQLTLIIGELSAPKQEANKQFTKLKVNQEIAG